MRRSCSWPSAAALSTACASSSPSVVSSPTGGAPVRPVGRYLGECRAASSGRARPAVRIVPATGLHNRQRVQVHGSGFTPGEALQVVECAQRGRATGRGIAT